MPISANAARYENIMEKLLPDVFPNHDGTHRCIYRDLLYDFGKKDYIHSTVERLAGIFFLSSLFIEV